MQSQINGWVCHILKYSHCSAFATIKSYSKESDYFKIQIGFKNLITQAKQIGSVIQTFKKYQEEQYKAVMYSYTLRSLGRIIRRDYVKNKKQIHTFLGQNYQRLRALDISHLDPENIVDIINFILCHQNQGFSITDQTKQVVDYYLQSLINILQKDPLNKKRRLNHVLFAARCSQLFKSNFYRSSLKLLQQELQLNTLNIYNLKLVFKFLLKMQHLICLDQQIAVFRKIILKLKENRVLQNIEMINIRMLYGSLASIMQNYLFVTNTTHHPLLDNIQKQFRNKLPQIQAIEFIRLCQLMIKHKNQNCHLFQFIYKSVFSQIKANGQTSFNPSFIFAMTTILSAKQTKFLKSDWKKSIINMINRYYISNKQNYKTQQLSFLNAAMHSFFSKPLFSLKAVHQFCNYFDNNSSFIVPYDKLSFTKEVYHLRVLDWQNIYTDILQLQSLYSNTNSNRIFSSVFDQIKRLIPNQIKSKYKSQANKQFTSLRPVSRRKFINLLIKISKLFQKYHLVLEIIKIQLQYSKRNTKHQLNYTLSNLLITQLPTSMMNHLINFIINKHEKAYCNLIVSQQSSTSRLNTFCKVSMAIQILQRVGNQLYFIKFIKNKVFLSILLQLNKQRYVDLIFTLFKTKKMQTNQFQYIMWSLISQSRQLLQRQQTLNLIQRILQIQLTSQTFFNFLIKIIVQNNFYSKMLKQNANKLNKKNNFQNQSLQTYLSNIKAKKLQIILEQTNKVFGIQKMTNKYSYDQLNWVFFNIKSFRNKEQQRMVRLFHKTFLRKHNQKFEQLQGNKQQKYCLSQDMLILKYALKYLGDSQILSYVDIILNRIKLHIQKKYICSTHLFFILKLLNEHRITHDIINKDFFKQLLTPKPFLKMEDVLSLISLYPIQKDVQIIQACVSHVINQPVKNIQSFIRIFCLTKFNENQKYQSWYFSNIKILIERLLKNSEVKLQKECYLILNQIFPGNKEIQKLKPSELSVIYSKVQHKITFELIQKLQCENSPNQCKSFMWLKGKNFTWNVYHLMIKRYFQLSHRQQNLQVYFKKGNIKYQKVSYL